MLLFLVSTFTTCRGTFTFPFTKFLSENFKGRKHFEDLDIDGKTRDH